MCSCCSHCLLILVQCMKLVCQDADRLHSCLTKPPGEHTVKIILEMRPFSTQPDVKYWALSMSRDCFRWISTMRSCSLFTPFIALRWHSVRPHIRIDTVAPSLERLAVVSTALRVVVDDRQNPFRKGLKPPRKNGRPMEIRLKGAFKNNTKNRFDDCDDGQAAVCLVRVAFHEHCPVTDGASLSAS